ncbi:MAG: DNA polymerase III subunit epsilon [Rhodanobacter sp.]
MRQVVLDTETTGLEVSQGHRLIEIACVELDERRVTGREYQTYLNPGRAIDEGARAVTGIADEFLLDKPLFADVVDQFLAFVEGAELVIHNAAFDVGFLDAELALLEQSRGSITDHCGVLDTLAVAREQYPGQRNSLDALCRRFGVDNSRRELHGGLLDAQLLAAVYLAMTSGQAAFDLGFDAPTERQYTKHGVELQLPARPLVQHANLVEQALHEQRLDALEAATQAPSIWRSQDEPGGRQAQLERTSSTVTLSLPPASRALTSS